MKKCVLLLEDEMRSRQSMAALLRSAGHEVIVARNALEAQVLCTDCEPDLAVVDVQLPGLRGDEWALHLKESLPQTRVIFVSGLPGLAGLDRYGPDVVFLQKPISPDEFLEIVNQDSIPMA